MTALAAVIAWCAKHPKLVANLAFAFGLSLLLLGLYAWGHHRGVVREAAKVEAAQTQARAAEAQAAFIARAAEAADEASTTAAKAAATAQEAAHAIQSAEGASASVPPSVLAEWRTGLDRLRGDAPAAPAAGAGGAKPAGAVPSAKR